jgi:hypothetical protein
MTRRFGRLALVGAAATSVIVTGMGPAQAAELITKRSCRAEGGTFAVVDGYRQCTKVVTYDESLGVNRIEGTDGYVGETEPFITIRYTTVERQRGAETPSLTGGDEILASWTEYRCYLDSILVDNAECESRGLFG